MSAGSSKTLTHDDESRLSSVAYSGVTDTYVYNWEGLRTRARLKYGLYHRYLYNGQRVLQDLMDDGEWHTTYTTEDGTYEGTLVAIKRYDLEQERFPLYDSIGTALGLVCELGTVTDSYDMDTFGAELDSTVTTPNPYRYGAAWGYITDPSGLLQLGARFYWPEVGRFVSQDPIGDAENAYAHAGDEPLNSIDPEGLHESSSWWHNLRHWETWREGVLGGWRGGYYSCYAKCATIGLAKHAAAEKAAPHVARGYARWAWHHKYPRWFRAWGKYSKVHVPATAGKLAKGLGAASLAYLDYELFRCIAECAECVRFGR